MSNKYFRPLHQAGLLAGTVLLGALAGCLSDGTGPRTGYQGRTTGRMQAGVLFEDDYDYYPGYEVYYSRNRHEYVYRDGNTWVRRPAPRGVELNVLLAAPSVRVDFHDAPEQHHSTVVQTYPRNWKRPDQQPAKDDRRDGGKDDKKDEKKDEHRKD
jgi:hypothetical protein